MFQERDNTLSEEDWEDIIKTLKDNNYEINSKKDLMDLFKKLDEIGKNHLFDDSEE